MRIVMLGAPGSGKGTQAQRIQKDHGLPQVSTGDLLRRAVADKTPLGLKAKKAMDAGELVSDEIVLGMIKERIAQADAKRGFILDGFPRNTSQANSLDALLTELKLTLDRVVLMDVDFEILMKRLTGRRTCSKTGQILNIYFSTPAELEACRKAGGELLQREDDNEATIRNRLQVYERQTAPLVDYYTKKGLLKTITATGEVDAVYSRLKIRPRPEVRVARPRLSDVPALLAPVGATHRRDGSRADAAPRSRRRELFCAPAAAQVRRRVAERDAHEIAPRRQDLRLHAEHGGTLPHALLQAFDGRLVGRDSRCVGAHLGLQLRSRARRERGEHGRRRARDEFRLRDRVERVGVARQRGGDLD